MVRVWVEKLSADCVGKPFCLLKCDDLSTDCIDQSGRNELPRALNGVFSTA